MSNETMISTKDRVFNFLASKIASEGSCKVYLSQMHPVLAFGGFDLREDICQ